MAPEGTVNPAAVKDAAHLTPEWDRVEDHIDGVRTREVKNIVTGNGTTVEVYREDWGIATAAVTAMIHVTLRPGAVSAWHMHQHKTDHLFVIGGLIRAVLYDDRDGSTSKGRVEVLNLSPMRPTLVVIPPRVWHGIQVLSAEPGTFVNFFDRAYDYADPDDWRLPPDSPEVPYRF